LQNSFQEAAGDAVYSICFAAIVATAAIAATAAIVAAVGITAAAVTLRSKLVAHHTY
jgi:hypothetical protein